MPSEATQFKPGIATYRNGGRPKEHPLRGKVSMDILNAIVRLLGMRKEEAMGYMKDNPTMTEITAWKYINDYPTEVIDRFCGRIPKEEGYESASETMANTPREIVQNLLDALEKPVAPRPAP